MRPTRSSNEAPFAIARRGYERSQVDAYVAENERWSTQAWQRIQLLEAKVSELEGICATSEHDRAEARQLAEQAHARIVESERTAAKVVDEAEIRAAGIFDVAARSIEEARDKVVESNKKATAADEERILRAGNLITTGETGTSLEDTEKRNRDRAITESAERLDHLRSLFSERYPSPDRDGAVLDPTGNHQDGRAG